MTTTAQASPQEAEVNFLEGLRSRYEGSGYKFTIHPKAECLPEFLGTYRPDALAEKEGSSIAIEVKSRRTPAAQRRLVELRRLFEGRANWQFHVAYMGADPLLSISIPSGAPDAIRDRSNEVTALAAAGHRRAAFVMAWSLLEAAMRSRGSGTERRPWSAGTVVQALAMDGYIGSATEQRLRALVDLRNRIIHGDLTAEPSEEDIATVVGAVEEALVVDAA